MCLWQLLLCGEYLLIGSLVFSGRCGQFINPAVGLLIIMADRIAKPLASWARTNHGVRQVIFAIGLVVAVLLVCGVRQWSIGLALILVGHVSNLAAVQANGLRMPTPPGYDLGLRHMPRNSRTRLWLLCDRFEAPSADGSHTFSIGDILQIVGWWVFAAELWLARFF